MLTSRLFGNSVMIKRLTVETSCKNSDIQSKVGYEKQHILPSARMLLVTYKYRDKVQS